MGIHKDFYDYPPTLSVRRQSQLRPTIIIGQDESVFKQYSFGQRCWFGHQWGDQTTFQNQMLFPNDLSICFEIIWDWNKINRQRVSKSQQAKEE